MQEYDKEQPRQQEQMLKGYASRTEKEFEDVDGNANSQVQEFRWVSLLRNDKYGQFMDSYLNTGCFDQNPNKTQ